ncbi:F-box/LRR-repeat protein 8-like [Aplysia californica]|uniref:F-box/LRR-repeat protein 8-like n=1 Tax=Aplysia californica TaxID=6500 RepID=A0ABM1VR59_APLCA|nr:F-box/LRR-repeat protein 8-like [Aplysia californica]
MDGMDSADAKRPKLSHSNGDNERREESGSHRHNTELGNGVDAESEDLYADWANLPEPLVTHILSFLSALERCRVGATCKNWRESLDNPVLWKTMKCGFFLPAHGNLLKFVQRYGQFVNNLTVALNQKETVNRMNAIAVFKTLNDLDHIRLTHITVQFKGDNPLFYAGQEFMAVLSSLFEKMGQQPAAYRSIRYLNFREMKANFEVDFISHIAASCPQLEYLNILNGMLVCKVSPHSMVDLVQRCEMLKELHLYHCSLSNDVLRMFTEPGRQQLLKLGVVCRRAEKYGTDISSEAWSALVLANPDLRVDLGFDHTCPYHRIAEILKPEIPVKELHFATYTRITLEVNLAKMFYDRTLEKLVVHTKPNAEFEQTLLALVRACRKLHTLYVYGVLRKEVIEEIFTLSPEMKSKGSYILKWEMEPEPWTVGEEDDDGV